MLSNIHSVFTWAIYLSFFLLISKVGLYYFARTEYEIAKHRSFFFFFPCPDMIPKIVPVSPKNRLPTKARPKTLFLPVCFG